MASLPETPAGGRWPFVDLLAYQHHTRWMEMGVGATGASKDQCGGFFDRHIRIFAADGWES